jgi:ubiquinol-cytochrome c reductase cytochrome c subunit
MTRRRRIAAWMAGLVGLLCAALGVAAFAAAGSRAQRAPDVASGRELFASGCSACHGFDAHGVPGKGPSLVGVGARAAHFYISTGRMPLAHPTDEPVRAPSPYTRTQQADLIAYVGSLGGPPVPPVDPASGSLSLGKQLFTDDCAGCHQVVARGGVVTPSTIAPALNADVSATNVAEAVRIGPWVMPRFGERELDQHEVDSVARYVLSTQHLDNAGGWGIGNIGPIPEGLVAWLVGLVSLLVVARLVGERSAP